MLSSTLRIRPAIAAAAVALSLLVAGPAAAAPATRGETDGPSIGIRLLDVPTAAQDDPRAQNYIVDNVAPGDSITRRIEVANDGGSAQLVDVYSGSAAIVDGEFVGDDRTVESDLTTWMSVSSPTVELAAGETEEISVTIDVPADAPEGEFYGAVWAQITTASATATGTGVAVASRAGVRVYLSVGPGNGPPADFAITGITAGRTGSGVPTLTAQVENTGGRALDLEGTVSLTDGPATTSAGPFAVTTPTTLAPGSSGTISIELDPALADGPWQASIELTSGLLSRTASGEVTFPAAGGTAAVALDERVPLWAILLVVAIVLLAALLAWVLVRQRRISRRLASGTAGD